MVKFLLGRSLSRSKAVIWTIAPQKLLSERVRCRWGISEAMRSRKLADCALPPKWIDGFQQSRFQPDGQL
jgi:hypothetical protein